MAQSLSKLFVHLIFHIKTTSVKIKQEDSMELYANNGAILKDNASVPVIINGTENQVYILCVMSKNIALAKLVEEIKRHSSKWIKTKNNHYSKFSWQGGYASFSVSSFLHDKTKSYIAKQKEHHKKNDF